MLVKSQIKYIQSLGQKKFRDSEGVFFAEGPKIINELLQLPNVEPIQIFAVNSWIENSGFPAGSSGAAKVLQISDPELARISLLSSPNQVAAIFKKPSFRETSLENRVSLVLDGIQDPGNLGTITRIADWFGIGNILCSEDSTDIFNPKTVQSTMGSIARVNVRYGNIIDMITGLASMPVYAAMLHGESIYGMQRIKKGLIVIGNESKGIREEMKQLVQYPVHIPGAGFAESLNAAVATGIVLSHLVGA